MAPTMETLERFRNIHRGLAPNLTTLGFFEDTFQLIGLPAVTQEDIDATKGNYNAEAHSRVYPLLCHELRHWFDFVGTLWGQKQLLCLFNALDSRLNNDPKKFQPLVTYANSKRRIHLLDYYTTTSDSAEVANSREKWVLGRTIGHKFSATGEMLEHSLILLVNFQTQDGTFVGRSPISISSLLETGAMFSEMATHVAILETVPKEEWKEFAPANMTTFFEQFEYNPTMRPYSVAAHLTANALHIEHTLPACGTASGLANLALNMSDSHFEIIRRAKTFDSFADIDIDLRAENDPSYAFITLLDNLSSVDQSSFMQSPVDMDTVLSISNLPSASELMRSTASEMRALKDSIVDGPFRPYMEMLVDYGCRVFEQRGPMGYGLREIDAVAEKRFLPPILLGDNNLWLPEPGNGIRIWDELEPRWDLTAEVLDQIDEFVRICGL